MFKNFKPFKKTISVYDSDSSQGLDDCEEVSEESEEEETSRPAPKLVDMPLDVLLEIFRRLFPVDLLVMSRTKKKFRAILFNRANSATAWKGARSHFPGLPVCPKTMSEPLYAHLSFEKMCDACDKTAAVSRPVWATKMRLCKECEKKEFVEEDDLPGELTPRMERYIPTVVLDKRFKRNGPKALYSSTAARAVFEASGDERQDMLTQFKFLKTHEEAWEMWSDEMAQKEKILKEKLVEERIDRLLAHLRESKWGHEIRRMGDNANTLRGDSAMLRAAKKDFSDNSCSKLVEDIASTMTEIKKARINNERGKFLKQCLPVLKTVVGRYLKTLPVNAVYPSVGEIFNHPITQGIITDMTLDRTVVEERFDVMIHAFPIITSRWKTRATKHLTELVMRNIARVSNARYEPTTVLDLAVTTFKCTECSARGLRYPGVLMHPCAIICPSSRSCAIRPRLSVDEGFVEEILSEVPWNTAGVIQFDTEGFSKLVQAINATCMDPLVCTTAQMDALDPVLECMSCHKEREGRAVLSWSSVLPHHFSSHNRQFYNHSSVDKHELQLLSDDDAQSARPRLEEERQRRLARSLYQNMVCAHCKKKGNLIDLMKHVSKDHNISSSTKTDIVQDIGSAPVSDMFFKWPPRIIQTAQIDADSDSEDRRRYRLRKRRRSTSPSP